MDIKIGRESLVVKGIPEIVASNARTLKEQILSVLTESHKAIELDLSQTTFIDSTGLGVLISLDKAVRARKGVVRLLHPTNSVMTVLELTRLHRVFEVVLRDADSSAIQRGSPAAPVNQSAPSRC
jgi:anti-sigma B factor antagonist